MSTHRKQSSWLKNYGLLSAMLVAIVAGCVVGALFPATEESSGAKVLEPLGTVFINMILHRGAHGLRVHRRCCGQYGQPQARR